LFASTAHAGQINPLLSIAGELSERAVLGLWFASTDDRRADIEASSMKTLVRFVSYGTADLTKELIRDPAIYAAITRGPLTTGSFLATLRWLFDARRLAVEYRRMLAHIDCVQPRLMVIDLSATSTLDAAMARRIPFILSVPCTPSALFMGRLPWDYPSLGSGLPRQMDAKQRLANLWYQARLRIVQVTRFPFFSFAARRIAMGIANPTGSLARYSDAATAIFCYSVFGLEYPFPAPSHLYLLGAMVPSALSATQDGEDELSRWLHSHRSVIYVSLGTLVRLSRAQITALVNAFGRLAPNHYVLWKLPDSQWALLPPGESLPINLRIVHWVPSQLGVLAHPNVRVFLTHGGGNGFHEGIYFGKPLLVMPFWLDCFDFAVRAIDSGVGLALDCPPAFTADEVAAKLGRLLSDSGFHERARYWGEQLRKAGGVSRAADLILQFATG
jgi:polyene glycosyltransferase